MMRECEKQLRDSINLHDALDRVQLVVRRRTGSLLHFVQRLYKPLFLADRKRRSREPGGTPMLKFYEYIQVTYGLPMRATKEYLAWYRLCEALPSIVRISVPRWSEVLELMKDRVLRDAISTVASESRGVVAGQRSTCGCRHAIVFDDAIQSARRCTVGDRR